MVLYLLSSFHLHVGLFEKGFVLSPQCSLFPVFLGRALYCNYFSIPSSFWADSLNYLDAFSVCIFAFLQHSFGVYFIWVEHISLLPHPYHVSVLNLSVHMPHPSRPKTGNLSVASLVLGLMSR